MKPTRFLIVALVLMGLVSTASAITRAGSTITNIATGTYQDASGTQMTGVTSASVTTTVSQVAFAAFNSVTDKNMGAMASTLYSVSLTNNGNFFDTFAIGASAVTSAGSFSYEIFHDIDGLGTLDQVDIDAGAITSTGSIDAGVTYNMIVRVTDTFSNGSPLGSTHTLTMTATSAWDVSQNAGAAPAATVAMVTTIQRAAISASITMDTQHPLPGGTVTYSICFDNTGDATGYGIVYTTTIPTGVTYAGNVMIDGVAANPASVNYNNTTDVLTVNVGDIAGPTSNYCVTYDVSIPSDAPAGLDLTPIPGDASTNPDTPGIVVLNEAGDPYPNPTPSDDTTSPSVAQVYNLTVTHTGAASTSFTGEASITTIAYPFTVTNTGNGSDDFDLSSPVADADAGDVDFTTAWTFYVDSNGNGILDGTEGDTPVTVLNTGTLASSASISYIATATILGGTADQANDNITFTATSSNTVETTPASDSASGSILCNAPVIVDESGLLKTVSPTGDQPPGTTLTYSITVSNSGHATAQNVVITDNIPANTTYQANTTTIGGTAKTDIVDTPTPDEVEVTTTGGTNGNGVVTVTFPTLAVGSPQVITFQVKID